MHVYKKTVITIYIIGVLLSGILLAPWHSSKSSDSYLKVPARRPIWSKTYTGTGTYYDKFVDVRYYSINFGHMAIEQAVWLIICGIACKVYPPRPKYVYDD